MRPKLILGALAAVATLAGAVTAQTPGVSQQAPAPEVGLSMGPATIAPHWTKNPDYPTSIPEGTAYYIVVRGDTLSLRVKGAAGPRTVELKLAQTPEEIPLNDATLLYNKVMMDLRQQVEGYPGTEPAAFARLNLALCSMHFGDFAAAHEHLLKARGELPQRAGLSQGTALYYLGLALDRLGYAREAAESYRAAAGAKDATLFDNDGPLIAALAVRRGGP